MIVAVLNEVRNATSGASAVDVGFEPGAAIRGRGGGNADVAEVPHIARAPFLCQSGLHRKNSFD